MQNDEIERLRVEVGREAELIFKKVVCRQEGWSIIRNCSLDDPHHPFDVYVDTGLGDYRYFDVKSVYKSKTCKFTTEQVHHKKRFMEEEVFSKPESKIRFYLAGVFHNNIEPCIRVWELWDWTDYMDSSPQTVIWRDADRIASLDDFDLSSLRLYASRLSRLARQENSRNLDLFLDNV